MLFFYLKLKGAKFENSSDIFKKYIKVVFFNIIIYHILFYYKYLNIYRSKKTSSGRYKAYKFSSTWNRSNKPQTKWA